MVTQIHWLNMQVLFEVLLADHLFAWPLTHRKHFPARLFGSTALALLLARAFPASEAALTHVIPYGTVMYLTLFLLSAAALFFCYRIDLLSVLFCAMVGYTVHQLASAFNDMCYRLPLPEPVIYLVTLGVTLTACYAAFSGFIRKTGEVRIDNRKMLLLSAFILLVDVILGLVNLAKTGVSRHSEYQSLISMYNAICCIFILSLLFSLLSNRRLEQEVRLMTQLLEEEKKQYELSKENIDMINLKCHDLKHQIRSLRKGTEVVDKAALKEIENAVGIYDSVTRTGNEALDLILTEKSLLCEKEGIRLTCIADGASIGFLPPTDIYALFGNAVDNAVEAVRRLPDLEKRNIGLTVQSRNALLSIHVENYFSGTLTFQDDLPVTTKEDRDNHGFGMRSMRLIAERYGGYLIADAADDIFHLNIVIPVEVTE